MMKLVLEAVQCVTLLAASFCSKLLVHLYVKKCRAYLGKTTAVKRILFRCRRRLLTESAYLDVEQDEAAPISTPFHMRPAIVDAR
jgi:hypothetical protein